MKSTNTAARSRQVVSPQQVQKILNQTNWGAYQQRVSERVAKEVDAYEAARAKSLQTAAHLVFL
ncbi:MAG: hypothetical protein WCV00_11975 [Verrucomicrobiia bacterium]|jgi:hypothetical protein